MAIVDCDGAVLVPSGPIEGIWCCTCTGVFEELVEVGSWMVDASAVGENDQ